MIIWITPSRQECYNLNWSYCSFRLSHRHVLHNCNDSFCSAAAHANACGIKTGHPFLVEVSAQRRGRWQSHLTEAIAEVRLRASARVWGLKLLPRFGWAVLIRIITRRARILAWTYGIAAEMSERETVYLASWRHLAFAVPTRGNTHSRGVA